MVSFDVRFRSTVIACNRSVFRLFTSLRKTPEQGTATDAGLSAFPLASLGTSPQNVFAGPPATGVVANLEPQPPVGLVNAVVFGTDARPAGFGVARLPPGAPA